MPGILKKQQEGWCGRSGARESGSDVVRQIRKQDHVGLWKAVMYLDLTLHQMKSHLTVLSRGETTVKQKSL